MKIKTRGLAYFPPALSGVLMGLSFIPFYPWAVFFCFIPLWLFALKQKRLKPLLLGAWLCQLSLSLTGFSWAAFAIREFAAASYFESLLLFLAFCCFANLHIPLAMGGWFLLQKRLKKQGAGKASALLLLPLLSALSFAHCPMVFDWHFGYAWLYAGWPAAWTAEIYGFEFLGAAALFFNLLFLAVFQSLKKPALRRLPGKKPLSLFGAGLLAFAALNVWGELLKNRRRPPDQLARALVLQPAVSNQKQRHKETRLEILEQILQDTRKALKKYPEAEFVLWPEGGYPYPIDKAKAAEGKDPIQKWAAEFSIPLAVSAEGKPAPLKRKKPLSPPPAGSNSVFAFDSKGRLIQGAYDKTRLLPFAESPPLGARLPFLSGLFLGSRPFAAGSGANKTLRLSGLNIGVQICYEGLSAETARLAALDGADILANFTNDGWLGLRQAPWQHLYMTLARSVETGLPLIRAANSGFSAVISAKGDISSPAPFNREALNQRLAWLAEIPFRSKNKRTVFVSWGHHISQWLLWLLLAALALPRQRVLSRLQAAVRKAGL